MKRSEGCMAIFVRVEYEVSLSFRCSARCSMQSFGLANVRARAFQREPAA